MKFYNYITEFAEKRDKLTEEELAEARAPHLNKGKLTLKAVTVHGKDGIFSSKRWTAPKETPKTKTKKAGEEPLKGKKRKITEPIDGEKAKKNSYEGWEHTSEYNFDVSKGTPAVTKNGTTVLFHNEESKQFYEKEFAHLLSMDHVAKLGNPLNLQGGRLSVSEQSGHNKYAPSRLLLTFTHGDLHSELALSKDKNPFGADTLSDVEIEYANVADKLQGKGVMTNFFKESLPLWDSLGVQTASLLADLSVGGYAWSKYGFDFKSKKQHEEFLAEFQAFAKSKNVHLDKNNNYAHSWDISNQRADGYQGKYGDHIGKEFMKMFSSSSDEGGMDNAWRGTLNLAHGSKSRTLLNSYLNGKVTKEDLATHKQQQLEKLSPMEQSATLAHKAYSKNDIEAASKHYQDAMKHAKELSYAAKLMPEDQRAATMDKIQQIMSSIPFDMHGKMSEPSLDNKPMAQFKIAAKAIGDKPVFAAEASDIEISANLKKHHELAAGEVAASSKMKLHSLVIDKIVSENKKEQVVVLDSKGNVNFSKEGDEKSIPISMSDLLLFKNSVVIHNHPDRKSFSLDDVKMASMGEASELWASTTGQTYRLKPADGQGTFTEDYYNEKIAPSYQKHHKDVTAQNETEIAAGNISVANADANTPDAIWQRVSKELGLQYSYVAKKKKEEVFAKESAEKPTVKTDLEMKLASMKPKVTKSPELQLLEKPGKHAYLDAAVTVSTGKKLEGDLFGTPLSSMQGFDAKKIKDVTLPVNTTNTPSKNVLLIQEKDGRMWTYDNQNSQSSMITTSGGKEGMTVQQTLLHKTAQRMGIKAEIVNGFDHQGTRYFIAKRVGGDFKPTDGVGKKLKLQTVEELKTSLAHTSEYVKGIEQIQARKHIKEIVYAFEGGQGVHVGGSTGGLKVKVGDKEFFVKSSKGNLTDKHLAMEHLAGQLYKNFGMEAPNQMLHKEGDKTYLISDWVKDLKPIGKATNNGASMSDDVKTQIVKSYGIDVLMANWDSVGLEHENMALDSKGKIIHVDNGGALTYRAMGTPKGDTFGDTPTEMDVFSDKNKAPQAAQYYGKLSETDKVNSMNQLLTSVMDDKSFFEKAVKDSLGTSHTASEMTALTDKMFNRYKILMTWRDSVKLKAAAQKYEAANSVEADPKAERSFVLQHIDSLHKLLTTPVSKATTPEERQILSSYMGQKSLTDAEAYEAIKKMKAQAKNTGLAVTANTSKLEEQNLTVRLKDGNMVIHGKGTLLMGALMENTAHMIKVGEEKGFTVTKQQEKLIDHSKFYPLSTTKFSRDGFSLTYVNTTAELKAVGSFFEISMPSAHADKGTLLQKSLDDLNLGELTKRPTDEDMNKNKMLRYLWGTESPQKYMSFYVDYAHEVMEAAKGGVKVSHSFNDLKEKVKSFGMDVPQATLDKMKKREVVDGLKTWVLEGRGDDLVKKGLNDVWVGLDTSSMTQFKSVMSTGTISLLERGILQIEGSTSSAHRDIEGGGADSLYSRIKAGSDSSLRGYSNGNVQIHLDPRKIGDRLDSYFFDGDTYGKNWNPLSDGLDTTGSYFRLMSGESSSEGGYRHDVESAIKSRIVNHGGSELIIRRGAALSDISGITADSSHYEAIMKHYLEQGTTHVNGIRLDRFVVQKSGSVPIGEGRTFREWADTTYIPPLAWKQKVDEAIAKKA